MSGRREAPPARRTGAEPGLRRNAAWMFLGNGVFAACQWGTLVVLARLGGPELVGRFTLALAVTAPIMLFSQLAMRHVQAADAARRHPFSDYLAVRVTTTCLALFAILGVAALGGYERATAVAILAVGIVKGVESLSDVYYGLEMRRERLDLLGQSLILRGVFGLAALAIVVYATGDLLAGLLATAASWAAVWLLFDVRVTAPWRHDPCRDPSVSGARERFRDRARLAWTGVPLGITVMLVSLNVNVPRYFIDGISGTEAVGIFGVMAYFVVVGQLVANAVNDASSPRLANLFFRRDTAAFRRLLGRLCLLGLLLGVAGVALSVVAARPILTLIYGASFAVHADLLPWVMAVGLVSYVVAPIGCGLTMIHSFRSQPVMLGLAVAVNALGCLLLVPAYGLKGAALAWFAALLCQGLVGLGLIWHRLRGVDASSPLGLPRPLPHS